MPEAGTRRSPIPVTPPSHLDRAAPAVKPSSRYRPPRDQAHGLRQMFAASQTRLIPLVHNPHVGFGGVVMERLCTAIADLGLRTLVVDAADTASLPHELAPVDLAACIEHLSPHVAYLAARGLPLHYLDNRATTVRFLQALQSAEPAADVVLVHAGASDLRRMFVGLAPKPLLLVDLRPDSLTHAYGSMKLLCQRLGALSFDAVIAADATPQRAHQVSERLAECADHFLGAALSHCAVLDPQGPARAAIAPDLQRLVAAQLALGTQTLPTLVSAIHFPAAAAAAVGHYPQAGLGRLN